MTLGQTVVMMKKCRNCNPNILICKHLFKMRNKSFKIREWQQKLPKETNSEHHREFKKHSGGWYYARRHPDYFKGKRYPRPFIYGGKTIERLYYHVNRKLVKAQPKRYYWMSNNWPIGAPYYDMPKNFW